jgi:methylated-DNA-[protein]-cysteine S-methyltransferase
MAAPLRLFLDKLSTPIGDLRLVADEKGKLRLAYFSDHDDEIRRHLELRYSAAGFVLETARDPHGYMKTMARYFEGDLGAIDALPVEASGTPFQQEVWRALRTIPCGSTTSYGKLAEQIGRPAAVRAVGAANGANPIAVVVPCHRVIGSNGSLTGYGGGIERKRWLLDHEKGNGLRLF